MRFLLIITTALSLSSCYTSRVLKVHQDLGYSAVYIDPIYFGRDEMTLFNFKDVQLNQV